MTQTELTPTASLTGKWKPYPDYKRFGGGMVGGAFGALGKSSD